MAIKSYNTKADYDAAVKSTIESQVSMIETTREIIVDGVNVVTTQPTVGDVVFLDDQNKVIYVKGGAWIQKANIPAAWTHVGYVYFRKGKQVGVIHKDGADQKWLDVCQYAITAISSTSLTINLSMAPSYAQVATTVELASTDIDATNAASISAAVAAKAAEVGDTRAWWAYLANADGNKVDENGTQIIIQCDTCVDYRFYIVSATGCTIAHITWGDMPENSSYWRGERGYYTNYWGVMNIARTKVWATGSGRVPSANEPVGPRAGNDAPVKPSEFESSQYCADLRAAYKTYEEYLEKCYAVVCPQKYGCFALPSGKDMAEKYARMTAPTKSGGTKYKYPALYYGYAKSFGVDGLDFGDWYLPGVAEGTMLMKDETLAALAPSVSKMGTTAINNSTYRWFAQRYYVNNAWSFYGSYGYLSSIYVVSTSRAQAVALLEID
jgi:hypothetical protein